MLNFDQVGSRNLDKLSYVAQLDQFWIILLDLHKLSSCKFGQL